MFFMGFHEKNTQKCFISSKLLKMEFSNYFPVFLARNYVRNKCQILALRKSQLCPTDNFFFLNVQHSERSLLCNNSYEIYRKIYLFSDNFQWISRIFLFLLVNNIVHVGNSIYATRIQSNYFPAQVPWIVFLPY